MRALAQPSFPFECREDAIGRKRQDRDPHADGVGHGVCDGGSRGDYRRLTQADDTAVILFLAGDHVDLNLRNVADPSDLVELHVGIYHPPEVLVHDLMFEQRVTDSHADCTGNLAFCGLEIYNHTHILDRNHLVDLYDAGFYVHVDLTHLNATDPLIGELVAAADALARRDDRGDSQLRTRLFPGKILAG